MHSGEEEEERELPEKKEKRSTFQEENIAKKRLVIGKKSGRGKNFIGLARNKEKVPAVWEREKNGIRTGKRQFASRKRDHTEGGERGGHHESGVWIRASPHAEREVKNQGPA